MKIKTNELTGAALDWAAAKCQGYDYEVNDGAVLTGGAVLIQEGDYAGCHTDEVYEPSTNWSQGGPIIEREKLSVVIQGADAWHSSCPRYVTHGYGTTPLVAAMRCYVASKLGNEVDVPEELRS